MSSTTNGNARGNNRAVVETDLSAFLMADFRTQVAGLPVRGNFGARYVRTQLQATGYQAAGGGTPVTVDHEYNDFLPAVTSRPT